jgi:hypothetical protein
LQYFENAGAGDRHAFFGQLLQDREHHFLLAHGAAVFNLQLFGGEKLGG